MKQIILVRHGQATSNLPNSVKGGWSDVELTEHGIRQAEAVAKRLYEEKLGEIKLYSSDLRRAKHTAEIIGRKLGMTPILAPGLREHNAGIASGMDRKEIMKYRILCDPPTMDCAPYPEAETWGEFYQRVASFMKALSEEEERVILVGHGGSISIIVRWWINLPLSEYFNVVFTPANASISVLDINEWGKKRIERYNDTSHYSSIENRVW